MPYLTDYQISVIHGNRTPDVNMALLHMGFNVIDRKDDEKWYEYDEDMRELSLEFPELTFQLTGQGEQKEDRWRRYYRNGQVCGGQAVVRFEYPSCEFSDAPTDRASGTAGCPLPVSSKGTPPSFDGTCEE